MYVRPTAQLCHELTAIPSRFLPHPRAQIATRGEKCGARALLFEKINRPSVWPTPLVRTPMHNKPGEIIAEELAMNLAVGVVVLGDALVGPADEDPGIEHSGIV